MSTVSIDIPRNLAGYDPLATADDCWFDDELAVTVLEFFPQFLCHVKGRIAGQPMEPNPWERDFLLTLFCWKRPDGTRRYRESFVGIPRKNNKTTISAGIALFLLLCDREDGAEVYCAASKGEQAALLFDIAASMVRRNAKLSRMCKINRSIADRRIYVPHSDSFLRAIPADSAGSHGFNAHGVVVDEIHAQPNRDLYDVLKTSMAARSQPLFVSITTAGHDRESICYELWQHSRKVRDGVIEDPYFLPVLYETADDEDWKDRRVWKRVNPNYGRSVSTEYLEEAFQRALKTPAFENTFRNLHLNQWTESETRWLSSEKWDACQGEIPDLTGKACYAGMDLSSTQDLTALVYVFPIDGKFYVVPHFWCPEDVIREAPKVYQKQYARWIAEGLLNATPGGSVEYEFVRERLREDRKNYNIVSIGFDIWQAMDTYNQLSGEGFQFVKVSQGGRDMLPGIKATVEHVVSQKLVHDGNRILRWMVACTVEEPGPQGESRLSKKKSHGKEGTKGKIDGVVAMCMAMGQAMMATQTSGPLMVVG